MIKKLLLIISLSLVPILAVPAQTSALLEGSKEAACSGVTLGNKTCKDTGTDLNKVISTVINLLSIIVAIAAVIMIIISGLRFITSNGDSSSVSSAKNGIIYALIGLVVVALAQVIVKFVLQKATG